MPDQYPLDQACDSSPISMIASDHRDDAMGQCEDLAPGEAAHPTTWPVPPTGAPSTAKIPNDGFHVDSGRSTRGGPIGKNSHATRTLAERSAPPGVCPPRETMVALDGAVRGQFGGIHCRFSRSSLRSHGTGVSDCALGSTVRDISGSNPSRSATN